jgi:probable HAF family extracellular repeat protein
MAVLAVVLLTSAPVLGQSAYSVVTFPPLPGYGGSGARGANDTGAVVGFSQTGSGPTRAWFWRDSNGNGLADQSELVDLGAKAAAINGANATASYALSVHDSDVVVGVAAYPYSGNPNYGNSVNRAYTWRPGESALNDLTGLVDGAPSDEEWIVVGASNAISDGRIAAQVFHTPAGSPGYSRAVLLTPTGAGRYTFQYLDTVLTQEGSAFSLTENGLACVSRGYLWDGTTLLATGLADLVAVNIHGNLAANSNGTVLYKSAYDGATVTAGKLGNNYTIARSMNDASTIVGNTQTVKGGNWIFKPFRWQPGTGMVDLNSFLPRKGGVAMTQAHHVTAGGRITGSSSSGGILLLPRP